MKIQNRKTKTLEANQVNQENFGNRETDNSAVIGGGHRKPTGWMTLAIVGFFAFSAGLLASYWPAD